MGMAVLPSYSQQRLYIRMQNATVKEKKGLIKAPPTANGKPPPNFPGTKGEFEHMTSKCCIL